MLEICDLKANINDVEILQGVNLKLKKEKFTLLWGLMGLVKYFIKVLTGHPSYNITDGKIFSKIKISGKLTPEERAHLGLFLAFQYPVEVPGVSNEEFLRIAYNLKQKYLGLPEVLY